MAADKFKVTNFESFLQRVKNFKYNRVLIIRNKNGPYPQKQIERDVKNPSCFVISIGQKAAQDHEVSLFLSKKDNRKLKNRHKIHIDSKDFTTQYRFWNKKPSFQDWNTNEIFHLNSEIIGSLYFAFHLNVDKITLANLNLNTLVTRSFDKRLLHHFLSKYIQEYQGVLEYCDKKSSILESIDGIKYTADNFDSGITLTKSFIDFDESVRANDIFSNYHLSYDFDDIQSCAIVGSSGKLLNGNHGEEIDSHDCIVRFNAAPVQGYQEKVGSRTDLRFVNNLLAKEKTLSYTATPENWIRNVSNERLIFKDLSIKDVINVTKKCVNKNELYFLSDEMESTLKNFQDQHLLNELSLGLRSILVMLKIVEHLNLYGFDFYNNNKKDIHYWEEFDKSFKKKSQPHNWKHERIIIESIEKEGRLTLN